MEMSVCLSVCQHPGEPPQDATAHTYPNGDAQKQPHVLTGAWSSWTEPVHFWWDATWSSHSGKWLGKALVG